MISIFDIFKIGIGPSSSHTVGPMRAAKRFILELIKNHPEHLANIEIRTELFGSLSLTGDGHETPKAIVLGLSGYEPETIPLPLIPKILERTRTEQRIQYEDSPQTFLFTHKQGIIFHRRRTLPFHSNGMTFTALASGQVIFSESYYSVGGGTVVSAQEIEHGKQHIQQQNVQQSFPYPFTCGDDLLALSAQSGLSISTMMTKNEQVFCSKEQLDHKLKQVWDTMDTAIELGISTQGILPGGLKVKRRACDLYRKLQSDLTSDPLNIIDWVNLFALAVNEENAAGGRVVTAPTNGAAGIIPAVLKYYDQFIQPLTEDIIARYLLTAGAIGILYKMNASISGAEVGCQGEVGVACSMAAAGLTEILGGSTKQIENAAEIGMEHNLGLTCDPVGGLVQIPCIERNAMGSIKAINASRLALRGMGEQKVSLDKVIKTMRETGNDMKKKYKETAQGGLAVNIIEC